jgi:hypothetical protein
MELPTKVISFIGAGGTALATMWGGASFVDTRYAHAPDVVLIEMRLEQKILTDRSYQLQQRIWKIEDRYGSDLFEAPALVKEEHRQLKEELADVDQEIGVVQQEYKRQGSAGNRYYERKMPAKIN